jgi:hypothetical protein
MMANMESSDIQHNESRAAQFQAPEVVARKARYEAMAEERRLLLEESEQARFWFAVKTALVCVGGCCVGLAPMAWALHTTDVEAAGVAWAAGAAIGPMLVLLTLIIAAIKWDKDDW